MATLLKHTVKPSGGDYATLDEAFDHLLAAHADLVTADVYAEIEISGDWSGAPDTRSALLAATVLTSATCYVHVYTDAANRARPSWDASKYALAVSDAIGISSRAIYTRYEGLQISSSSPGADGRHLIDYGSGTFVAGSNDNRIVGCLLKGPNDATYYQTGIRGKAGLLLSIWNTVVYNMGAVAGTVGMYTTGSTSITKIYNSVVNGGQYGIQRASGTVTAKNCYAGGSSSGDYYGTIGLTTCASSDATGTAGLQSVLVDVDTFVNVTGGSEDFHQAADKLSPLYRTGTDTSGDAAPMNFTTDIDGDTYPAPRSIGADELVAAAATNVVCMLFDS